MSSIRNGNNLFILKKSLDERVKTTLICPDCNKKLEPGNWIKLNFVSMKDLLFRWKQQISNFKEFRETLKEQISEMEKIFDAKDEIFMQQKTE